MVDLEPNARIMTTRFWRVEEVEHAVLLARTGRRVLWCLEPSQRLAMKRKDAFLYDITGRHEVEARQDSITGRLWRRGIILFFSECASFELTRDMLRSWTFDAIGPSVDSSDPIIRERLYIGWVQRINEARSGGRRAR